MGMWAMLGCKLVHGTTNDDGEYKNGKWKSTKVYTIFMYNLYLYLCNRQVHNALSPSLSLSTIISLSISLIDTIRFCTKKQKTIAKRVAETRRGIPIIIWKDSRSMRWLLTNSYDCILLTQLLRILYIHTYNIESVSMNNLIYHVLHEICETFSMKYFSYWAWER